MQNLTSDMKLRANILALDVHDCEMEVSYNLSGIGNQYLYGNPVACQGGGGRGNRSRTSSSILVANFSKESPFGIFLQPPFFADQPQKVSKGAFGANITKFDGKAHTKKNAIFWSFFVKKKVLKSHL